FPYTKRFRYNGNANGNASGNGRGNGNGHGNGNGNGSGNGGALSLPPFQTCSTRATDWGRRRLRNEVDGMKLVVTGSTGFIGRALVRALQARGDSVVCLVREPGRVALALPGARCVRWDALQVDGEWAGEMEDAEAVVHLAGEPVMAHRWNADVKRRIFDTRELGTRHLVDAIARAKGRPSVFVCSSGVDYYGDTGDRITDEPSPVGHGFLSEVCVAWEREAARARSCGVRPVMLRTGIVVGDQGGALEKMITPFKFFVGGPVGGGAQWVSWIDRVDMVRVILAAVDDPRLEGAVNAVGPEPVRMRDFSKALGAAMGRASWAPVPGFALRIAVGEAAEVILSGKRVVPRALERVGFVFEHASLARAMKSAVSG
ncbi:MAG: TIGR01777 family oxidoreductase, partial [Deltaproteobacteria bacterium]